MDKPPKGIKASIATKADPTTDATSNRLKTLVDWGKVLDGFGLYTSALEQEGDVIRQNPKAIDAYIARGQIAIKHRATDTAADQEGLNDLSIAFAMDKTRSSLVMEAYLSGLVQKGQGAMAVALYERWAREGLVPSPISSSPAEILQQAPDQRLRVTYIQALRQSHQDDSKEKQALDLIGMRKEIEMTDIDAQSKGIVGDEGTVAGVTAPKVLCTNSLVSRAPHLQDVAITTQ